jgi:DNA invertase Pin-like site-specific DNA recombinase
MLIGYARVSTEDQDLNLQRAALKDVGCKRVYEEKVTATKRSRPQLDRMLDQLRAGDVVIVSRLDRLARSTREATKILNVHLATLHRALHP